MTEQVIKPQNDEDKSARIAKEREKREFRFFS